MSSFTHSFTLTWNIEVYNKNIFKKSLESAYFRIESFINTRWNLTLLREETDDGDWIVCYLKNECSFGYPESISLNYRLYINVGARQFFKRIGSITKHGPGCCFRVPFIQTQTLNHTHYPNGTLVVVCEMAAYKVGDHFLVAENLKSLSKDTTMLYMSKEYADLILFTDDRQMFEVHKFIIFSRWKEATDILRTAQNESNVSGVSGLVFEKFLRYLYSGKLPSRDVSSELIEFASENCEELRNDLKSQSNALQMCSRFNTQSKVLKFHIRSGKCLSRVIPLEGIYSPELQINIDPCDQTGEYFSVSFWFSDFQLDRPIYLSCHMLVEETQSGFEFFSTKQHVFVRGEEWFFPSFIRKSDFAILLDFQLVLTLNIGDGMLPATVETSYAEFRSAFRGVYDLHSLSRDFHEASRQSTFKDVIVETGNVAFLRHKAMLSARSSAFKILLERNMFIGNIHFINITPIDYISVMHLLDYIYSGSIGDLSREEIVKLRYLSELFWMHKLEEYCCIYLCSDSDGL